MLSALRIKPYEMPGILPGICQAFAGRTHRPSRLDESCFFRPAASALKRRSGIEKPLRGNCEARQFPLLATDY
jgi:hypothetical protein